MTRQDYILIAQILHERKPIQPTTIIGRSYKQVFRELERDWILMIIAFADNLGDCNPKFSKDLFIAHCELGAKP
jgi:hypothetical protein